MRTRLKQLASVLILLGLLVLLLTYRNFITAYFDYQVNPVKETKTVKIIEKDEKVTKTITEKTDVVFVDQDFGLYIPRIKANASVIKNVNPYVENEYFRALEKGVAHASGTSTPNYSGNVFLFAHSAVDFYEQRKYNIYFYLLNKLEKNDKIYVSYKGKIYNYKVESVSFVSPSEVKYLGKYKNEDTLTLMSCWPPGFNFKRTIVTAIREK